MPPRLAISPFGFAVFFFLGALWRALEETKTALFFISKNSPFPGDAAFQYFEQYKGMQVFSPSLFVVFGFQLDRSNEVPRARLLPARSGLFPH